MTDELKQSKTLEQHIKNCPECQQKRATWLNKERKLNNLIPEVEVDPNVLKGLEAELREITSSIADSDQAVEETSIRHWVHSFKETLMSKNMWKAIFLGGGIIIAFSVIF